MACQTPVSMGFSRQEYWSGLPFHSPGESCWPRDRTCVSCVFCIGERILNHWATWEVHEVARPLFHSCVLMMRRSLALVRISSIQLWFYCSLVAPIWAGILTTPGFSDFIHISQGVGFSCHLFCSKIWQFSKCWTIATGAHDERDQWAETAMHSQLRSRADAVHGWTYELSMHRWVPDHLGDKPLGGNESSFAQESRPGLPASRTHPCR